MRKLKILGRREGMHPSDDCCWSWHCLTYTEADTQTRSADVSSHEPIASTSALNTGAIRLDNNQSVVKKQKHNPIHGVFFLTISALQFPLTMSWVQNRSVETYPASAQEFIVLRDIKKCLY